MSQKKATKAELKRLQALRAKGIEARDHLTANLKAVTEMIAELEGQIIYLDGHNKKVEVIQDSNRFLKEAEEALNETEK